MDEPQKSEQKEDAKKYSASANPQNVKRNNIILAVIAVIVVGWVIVAISHHSSQRAKYQASLDISQSTVVNPATLSVSFKVKNIGNKAGAPDCQITVGDENYTYSGSDLAQLGTIQPGKTVTSADQITITKQGAQYVTTGTIKC